MEGDVNITVELPYETKLLDPNLRYTYHPRVSNAVG